MVLKCLAYIKYRFPYILDVGFKKNMPTTFNELIPKILEDRFPQKLSSKLELIYKDILDRNDNKTVYGIKDKTKKCSSLNLQIWKSFSNDLGKTIFQRNILTFYEFLLSIFTNKKLSHTEYLFSDKEMTNLYWLLVTFQKLIISYSTFRIIDDTKEFNNLVTKKFILRPLFESFKLSSKAKNLLKTLIFEQKLIINIINLKISSNLNSQMLLEVIDSLLLLLETLIFILLQKNFNTTVENTQSEVVPNKKHLYYKIYSDRKSSIPKTLFKKLQILIKNIPEHIKILKLHIQCYMKILKKLNWFEIFKIMNKNELFLIKLRKRKQYILSELILLQDRNILAYFRLINTYGCF